MVANIDDFTILVRCGAVQSAIETAPCRSPTLLTAVFRFKPKRIVTKVEPAQTFWRAEEYHQDYLEKRGQTSCHI
jgi:hypothetical protein